MKTIDSGVNKEEKFTVVIFDSGHILLKWKDSTGVCFPSDNIYDAIKALELADRELNSREKKDMKARRLH